MKKLLLLALLFSGVSGAAFAAGSRTPQTVVIVVAAGDSSALGAAIAATLRKAASPDYVTTPNIFDRGAIVPGGTNIDCPAADEFCPATGQCVTRGVCRLLNNCPFGEKFCHFSGTCVPSFNRCPGKPNTQWGAFGTGQPRVGR